jgi:hypothetical protein
VIVTQNFDLFALDEYSFICFLVMMPALTRRILLKITVVYMLFETPPVSADMREKIDVLVLDYRFFFF